MIHEVRCDAGATVHEVWTVEIPEDVVAQGEAAVRDYASEKVYGAEATFLSQEVDGETDREVTSVDAAPDPRERPEGLGRFAMVVVVNAGSVTAAHEATAARLTADGFAHYVGTPGEVPEGDYATDVVRLDVDEQDGRPASKVTVVPGELTY